MKLIKIIFLILINSIIYVNVAAQNDIYVNEDFNSGLNGYNGVRTNMWNQFVPAGSNTSYIWENIAENEYCEKIVVENSESAAMHEYILDDCMLTHDRSDTFLLRIDMKFEDFVSDKRITARTSEKVVAIMEVKKNGILYFMGMDTGVTIKPDIWYIFETEYNMSNYSSRLTVRDFAGLPIFSLATEAKQDYRINDLARVGVAIMGTGKDNTTVLYIDNVFLKQIDYILPEADEAINLMQPEKKLKTEFKEKRLLIKIDIFAESYGQGTISFLSNENTEEKLIEFNGLDRGIYINEKKAGVFSTRKKYTVYLSVNTEENEILVFVKNENGITLCYDYVSFFGENTDYIKCINTGEESSIYFSGICAVKGEKFDIVLYDESPKSRITVMFNSPLYKNSFKNTVLINGNIASDIKFLGEYALEIGSLEKSKAYQIEFGGVYDIYGNKLEKSINIKTVDYGFSIHGIINEFLKPVITVLPSD